MLNKKACILFTIGSLSAGGKERQILGLLKGLMQNKRYQTAIAVFHSGGVLESEASELVNYYLRMDNKHKRKIWHYFIDLVNQARKNKVQIVHTWGSGVWDFFGLIVGRYLNIPVIHGGIRSAPNSLQISERISRWSALLSDSIVANSKAGLVAYNLHNHQRANVIYNGIDLERFSGINPSDAIRSTICMVANFSKNKDHRTAILAFSKVKQSFPEITLTLVGHDAGTLSDNRNLVADLGLKKSINFFTNITDPGPFIAGSDICLLTTYTEGLPNVLLEYMALSKPVIVTDDKGCLEAIEPHKTGFIVPVSSPEVTAGCIVELLSKPELAKKMGIAGRNLVLEKFSLIKMILAYEDLYAQFI